MIDHLPVSLDCVTSTVVALGDPVVACLPLDQWFAGLKLAEDDGLKGDKNK
jgi:hypothetical protein